MVLGKKLSELSGQEPANISAEDDHVQLMQHVAMHFKAMKQQFEAQREKLTELERKELEQQKQREVMTLANEIAQQH